MWRRQRRLWWTSGGGIHWPPPTDHRQLDCGEVSSTKFLGCTSRRISPGPPTPCHSPRRHNSAYTFSAGWKEQVSHHPSSPHSTGHHWECADQLHHVWYGNCSAADRKTLQRTVNTAAKIIGAPLPSILDIFLARCSSKTNSIVKDPTHPSHSLFQLLPSGRRYRSIRARSARLLNSFFPQAVRALNSDHPTPPETPCNTLPPETWTPPPPPNTPPPTLPHQRKYCELFFVQFKCATHRWVGPYKPPVVTHSLYALDTFLTLLYVHNPQKTHICMFTCSCTTTNHLILFPSQLLDSQCFSLHMYSIYVKHS